MKIYEAEKKLGLEDNIRANASIIVDCPTEQNKLQNKRQIAVAGINDEDLYHVHSILVSTSWNKNDDIFDREQVWMAKSTPKYKPTNIEHDEKQLVGGIVDCWAVDENYNEIAADTPVISLSNLALSVKSLPTSFSHHVIIPNSISAAGDAAAWFTVALPTVSPPTLILPRFVFSLWKSSNTL